MLTNKKEGIGIFAKLLSGFILVIAITGIGEFYSYTQMSRLSDITIKMYNHPLQVTRAVLIADTNIVKIHRSMKDVALSATPIEIGTAVGFVDEYERIVYSQLGIVEKWILGEEGATLCAETIQIFREWKPIRDEVIALTKAGMQTQAFAITKGKGAKHVELLNKKMEELKNYASSKAMGMLNESQETNKTIISTTATIFIILIVLSGLFGYLLSRFIAKETNEREKIQDKLQESEERYRAVSENFPNGAVVLFDKDLKLVLADGTVLRDAGLTSKDMEGRKVQDTLPPDRVEELIPYYESALKGEFKKFDYEYGGIDFEVYTLPVKNKKGNVTFGMSMSQNVTARKQAEDKIKASLKEKETLLLEIHHRVKNNMQVISSLLSLQAGGLKDDRIKKALIDSQNRVKAMGTVHENLYKSKNLSALSILPFLKELAESVLISYQLSSDQVVLEINSDDILMGIDQALPLGLIVNELVSNSLKYAFPAGRKGKISIEANRVNSGTLHLKFSDDGIGIPPSVDWRNADSLGLKLVVNLVENQLDGSVKMETDKGTHFDFIFSEDQN